MRVNLPAAQSTDSPTSWERTALTGSLPPAATITFFADFKTVALHPNSILIGSGAQYYFEISYQAQLWDIGGKLLNYGYIPFTTQ